MSRILYILAANCDRKHLENFGIGLENSWIFFPKDWEPCYRFLLLAHSRSTEDIEAIATDVTRLSVCLSLYVDLDCEPAKMPKLIEISFEGRTCLGRS